MFKIFIDFIMNRDNAIAQMVSLSEGIIDVCEPLQELGIHLFNVLINYDDKRQVYLCNNPLWVNDYYLHELHQSSLYDNNPTLFQHNEYSIWPEHFDQPIMHYGLMYYSNRYGLTICHRKESSTAFYFFAGSPESTNLPHFFMNNASFLENFIASVHHKKHSLFEEARAVKLQRSIKEPNSPWGDEVVRLLQNNQNDLRKKRDLIEKECSINHLSSSPLFAILSPRQKQVLYGLSMGQSAKTMAKELNISQRTVERHLSLLKEKFPNYSYVELILELLNAQPKELLLNN